MTETWTLTGSLADFGLDPVGGVELVVEHDPAVWVDDTGDRLLVRAERAPFADDGTVSVDLAVTGGHYRVRTSPRSLFEPFAFPSPTEGTHSLHALYEQHHGVPAPSPLAPMVRGASAYEVAVAAGFEGTEAEWLASLGGIPGDPGASVVGARDNGDGAVSFLLSDGTETDPVTVPPGPAGRGIASVEDADGDGTATITFTDGTTASLPLPPGQPGQPGQDSTVPGPANTLSIGTVTSGPAAASITGTAPDQTLNLTLPPGPQGPPGVSSIAPGEHELRGTGVPEGVVTASPGTYYTDTAMTNGAVRWVKKTGTGTTGWVVIHGDTGWRDVTAEVAAAWQCTFTSGAFLRRDGVDVTLRINGSDGHPAAVPYWTPPAGYLPDTVSIGDQAALATITDRPTHARTTISPVGGIGVVRAAGLGAPLWGILRWTADQNWPTTLPGTPA